MADGFTRSTGKMAMIIAQNGPGITNFVTCVKTAYWNHTPMLLVTPQAANKTIGQGGFQEVEQMAVFKDMVGYQEEVRDPSRTAEVLNRVITKARRLSAPAQINIPRDFWTQVIDVEIPEAIDLKFRVVEAMPLTKQPNCWCQIPCDSKRCRVIWEEQLSFQKLAEKLDAPVCCNYQHNDAFPGSHPLYAGPLGIMDQKPGWNWSARLMWYWLWEHV